MSLPYIAVLVLQRPPDSPSLATLGLFVLSHSMLVHPQGLVGRAQCTGCQHSPL